MWIFALCLSTLLVVNVVQGTDPDPLAAISTDNPAVQKTIVDLTNDYRRKVDPPARNMLEMSWSKEIHKNVDKWVKQCKMEHSAKKDLIVGGDTCGENIYLNMDPISWEKVLKTFDDEKNNLIYGKGPKTEKAMTGHYTQQVWAKTNKMACAVAYCPNNGKLKYFYACQYCPAGNYVDSLYTPYKRGPTCGDCPNNCKNGLCTKL